MKCHCSFSEPEYVKTHQAIFQPLNNGSKLSGAIDKPQCYIQIRAVHYCDVITQRTAYIMATSHLYLEPQFLNLCFDVLVNICSAFRIAIYPIPMQTLQPSERLLIFSHIYQLALHNVYFISFAIYFLAIYAFFKQL